MSNQIDSATNNNECWLPVPSRDGYEVSSHGRVRRGKRILAQTTDPKGYLRVSFWTAKGSRKVSVHVLVAAAFLGQRPDGAILRHINGINTDNRPENLSYGNAIENEADKAAHGTKVCGTRHHSNKLTEAQVLEIRSRYVPRDPANGLHSLGREFGISAKSAEAIVKRRAWKHLP